MLAAVIAFFYNTLLGVVFDVVLSAKRTVKGWGMLVVTSVVTGLLAAVAPTITALILAAGTILYAYVLRSPGMRDMTRLSGKLRGLYAPDAADADLEGFGRDLEVVLSAFTPGAQSAALEAALKQAAVAAHDVASTETSADSASVSSGDRGAPAP